MNTETTPRVPIGKVVATVEFDLYADDSWGGDWTWFEYAEPGAAASGKLGTFRRECRTLNARVELVGEPEKAGRE